MVTINEGDILEIALEGTFNGEGAVNNVFHARVMFGADEAPEDVLDDVEAWIRSILAILRAVMVSVTIWQRLRVRRVSDGALVGERVLTPVVAGASEGSAQPPGTAILALLRTGVTGVLGKKFFGVPEDGAINADARYDSAAVTATINAMIEYADNYFGTEVVLQGGVYSRKLGQWFPITEIEVSEVPAYQRRRRQGRGS